MQSIATNSKRRREALVESILVALLVFAAVSSIPGFGRHIAHLAGNVVATLRAV